MPLALIACSWTASSSSMRIKWERLSSAPAPTRLGCALAVAFRQAYRDRQPAALEGSVMTTISAEHAA
jgi:hypothetical protein